MIQNLAHPRKKCVLPSVGLAWGNDGAIYQEKLDGIFTVLEIPGGLLAGEDIRGQFIAFDCVEYAGNDVRPIPMIDRLRLRDELCAGASVPVVASCQHGGALLQAVLARGGEGIVRKLPESSYFDTMTAAKRLATWVCVITLVGTGQSVGISDAANGQARGAVALRGGKCDQIRVGSLIKVEGFGLHPSGLIREPRPCKDTPTSWLIQF